MKTYEEFNTTTKNLKDDDPTVDTAENQGGNKLVKDSEKPKIYYRYFSRLSACLCCCFTKQKDKLPERIKKIKKIRKVLKDKFDLRKMIIDVASLIYNQRNILRILEKEELSPYTKKVNLMDLWVQELHEKNDEGDDNPDNLFESS